MLLVHVDAVWECWIVLVCWLYSESRCCCMLGFENTEHTLRELDAAFMRLRLGHLRLVTIPLHKLQKETQTVTRSHHFISFLLMQKSFQRSVAQRSFANLVQVPTSIYHPNPSVRVIELREAHQNLETTQEAPFLPPTFPRILVPPSGTPCWLSFISFSGPLR